MPIDKVIAVATGDAQDIGAPLREALLGADAPARAAAARIALVRNIVALSAELRTALQKETDPVAAREEIRALALLERPADADFLVAQANRFPAGMDAALAYAIARSGSEPAIAFFRRNRTSLRAAIDWRAYFTSALWTTPERVTATAARILGVGDELGWHGILDAARTSAVAVEAPVLVASLRTESESIRVATLWYIARGYAPDPGRLPQLLRDAVTDAANDTASDREAFGRELVLRLAGHPRREDERWLKWLETREADALLANDQDVLLLLSDAEFAVREKRCKELPRGCVVPKGKKRVEPQPVRQPDFLLPSLLPPGAADAALRVNGCRGGWLGTGSATVDPSGRFERADLSQVGAAGGCVKALETLIRLSLASNQSMTSSRTTDGLVFVYSGRGELCLDEEPPGAVAARETPVRAGDRDVRAPVVVKRVEPEFPMSARVAMRGQNIAVVVVTEATITKTGCVRNLRLVGQSQYPELNSAALLALSQWRFSPGLMNDQPVDVVFNLTVQFHLNP